MIDVIEIPSGYCFCGCGAKTEKLNRNYNKSGYKKGEYRRFISGHNGKFKNLTRLSDTKCACGCGNFTPYSYKFLSDGGVVEEAPLEYASGHFLKDKRNIYVEHEDYIEVMCTGGSFKIDKSDKEVVSKYVWHVAKTGYVRTANYELFKRKKVTLHRFLLDVKNPKILIDHVNRDKSDNRRSNLRLCTAAENARNSAPSKKNKSKTSKFKGVAKNDSGFSAKISIGTYETEEQAVIAFDQIAYFLHGEFAYLNFPENKEKYKNNEFMYLVRKEKYANIIL